MGRKRAFRSDGFSMPELTVGLALMAIVSMVAMSVIWLLNGERRLSRQDQAIEELSRQTRAILRSPDQCQKLFKCNVNAGGGSVSLASPLATLNMAKGLASYDASCAPSNQIAMMPGSPLGESTLTLKRLQLTNPMLLAYNALPSGTVATVSYRMEAEVADVLGQKSGAAPAHRAVTFSDVALLIDATNGQVVGCGNAGRSSSPTFAACATSNYVSQVNGSTGAVACGADPTCPSSMYLDCAALASLKNTSVDPAIYFSGLAPVATVSATASVCAPNAISNYYGNSGAVTLAGTSLTSLTSFGGSVYVNADTVGSGQLYSGGSTAIVARTVADVIAAGNGGTCISAQTIGSVSSGAGGDVSLYGRHDGPVTVQGVNQTGGNLYAQDVTFITAPVVSIADMTLKNVILPSLGSTFQTLHMSGGTVNGGATMSNGSAAAISNATFNSGFNEGAGGSVTMASSTVKGDFVGGASVTTTLDGVTITGGLSESTCVSMTISNSTIGGPFSTGNSCVTTLTNVKIAGGVTASQQQLTFTGVTVGGNFDRGSGSTYAFHGGSIAGNVSAAAQATTTFDGTHIYGGLSTANSENTTFTNGAVMDGALYVNSLGTSITIGPGAVVAKVTGPNTPYGPFVRCTGGGKVLDKSGAGTGIIDSSCP